MLMKKIIEFINKKIRINIKITAPQAFVIVLILSGIYFTNLKQYSLSKWFQIY